MLLSLSTRIIDQVKQSAYIAIRFEYSPCILGFKNHILTMYMMWYSFELLDTINHAKSATILTLEIKRTYQHVKIILACHCQIFLGVKILPCNFIDSKSDHSKLYNQGHRILFF